MGVNSHASPNSQEPMKQGPVASSLGCFHPVLALLVQNPFQGQEPGPNVGVMEICVIDGTGAPAPEKPGKAAAMP